MNGMLGIKLGMASIFEENGDRIPVTVIEARPGKVVQNKIKNKDGYDAVQIGFLEITKKKRVKKPLEGHFKKASVAPMKYLREFKSDGAEDIEIGKVVDAGIFNEGEMVDVSGISKGKGFAGVMKRHGFKGFSASRGTHESFRGGGSIGMHSDPGRVFKGKRMAGHMGNKRVTVQNLKIIKVVKDKNFLFVRGCVPGANGGLLEIRKSKKLTEG